MIFRKLESDEKFHIVDYVKDYLQKHDDVEILIGGDSQNRAQRTIYTIAVALYHKGRGAHLVYSRWSVPREYSRSQRLLNEVWKSLVLKNHKYEI